VNRDPRSTDRRRFRWVLSLTLAAYTALGVALYLAKAPPQPEWVARTFRVTELLLQPDEAELRRRAEEEARRKAEAEARKRAEEEARRLAEEEARRKAEEEARRKAEEEARRKAEEEARRLAEEEARRKAEEEARRRAAEEALKRAEEEARRKAEEEARRLAEAEAARRAAEEAARRAEEEARRRAEEEARRLAEEEARRKAEEEARRIAEEQARIRAAEEARVRAEEEARRQAEAEARRIAEEEARRKAAEEARIRAEEEARRIAEEQARLAKIRAALEEKRRREEEARRNQEAAMSAGLMADLEEMGDDLDTFLPESEAPLVEGGEGTLLGAAPPVAPAPPTESGPSTGRAGIDPTELAEIDALLTDIGDLEGIEALLGEDVAAQSASREEILAFLDDVAKGRLTGSMVARATTVVESPFKIVGEVGGTGIRKAEAIARIIRSHRGELAHLYDKALVIRPGFEGLVTVRMVIAADGTVADAAVLSSSTGYAGFDEALVRRVLSWRFPAVAGGEVTGIYPFRFSEGL
jgi:TonB family protein